MGFAYDVKFNEGRSSIGTGRVAGRSSTFVVYKVSLLLTFLDHLLVQVSGHYPCHPVLCVWCHILCHLVFPHAVLYNILPFHLVVMYSISWSLRVSATLLRCECFLASGSGKTTSIISFQGQFIGVLIRVLQL